MLSKKQLETMAKLIYLNLDGGAAGEWEKIPKEKQDDYIRRMTAIEENLSRLNLAILPMGYVKPDERKDLSPEVLKDFMRGFVISKVDKPDGIKRLFPFDELAAHICKEFKI